MVYLLYNHYPKLFSLWQETIYEKVDELRLWGINLSPNYELEQLLAFKIKGRAAKFKN
jgi:hypothetical protein